MGNNKIQVAMKAGKYRAKVKCTNVLEAMLNGLHQVFPETVMIYDGNWCRFYKDKKEVWDCNPQFAKANFEIKAVGNDR